MAQQTVQEAIEKAAIDGVASVTVDGTNVQAMDIEKLIAADNYLRQRASSAARGLRFLGQFEPGK